MNNILNTDSYKLSHWLQYPPGTEYVSSYIESRGGKWSETLFFGLQAFVKEYLLKPFTMEDINEAEEFSKLHGEPFNREGFEYILKEYKGFFPVRIESVPEGTIVPVSNVLVQVVNTDPKCFWVTSFLETALLRAIWYPTTVATNSYMTKKVIYNSLKRTSDDPDMQISFKLHDFGARGSSSMESAALGGMAHLVNFMGTDTIVGIMAARKYYGEEMAGFSIPAAEHSTMTTWGGPEKEVDAFRNMLKQFAGPGKLVAVVSDSYDIYNATRNIWGEELREEVIKSGATVVIRPDSGDPTIVPIDIISILMDKFGYRRNEKGFKVLPTCVRVIQGDGINIDSISTILQNMEKAKLSADNIAFGMGGGLLQDLNRDTLMFAMKANAVRVDGSWRDVWKKPVTDDSKSSKAGRLALTEDFRTIKFNKVFNNLLKPIYENGKLLSTITFEEVRANASKTFK